MIKTDTKQKRAALTSGVSADGMQINYVRKPAPAPAPDRKTLKESGALPAKGCAGRGQHPPRS
jgi:hypothetical protein